MKDFFNGLQGTPIPLILILVGLLFISFNFIKKLGDLIELDPDQKKWTIPIGIFILTIGLILQFTPEKLFVEKYSYRADNGVTGTFERSNDNWIDQNVNTYYFKETSRNSKNIFLKDVNRESVVAQLPLKAKTGDEIIITYKENGSDKKLIYHIEK